LIAGMEDCLCRAKTEDGFFCVGWSHSRYPCKGHPV
jgi:hypothetical protein